MILSFTPNDLFYPESCPYNILLQNILVYRFRCENSNTRKTLFILLIYHLMKYLQTTVILVHTIVKQWQ